MSKNFKARPSAATVISVIALVAAVTGIATANPGAHSSKGKLSAKKVRAIANGVVSARAPGLTVGGASPALFAQVNDQGQVAAARSKGITNANIVHTDDGVYCFKGLTGVRGAQATLDLDDSVFGGTIVGTQVSSGCPAGTNIVVSTFDVGGTLGNNGFFVTFYK